MNFYETLGVPIDADLYHLKAAYRRQSSAHHPDKGGDSATMQAINRAFEVLSDPEARARYDATGSEGDRLGELADGLLAALFDSVVDGDGPLVAPLAGIRGKLVGTAETIKAKQREVGRALVAMEAKRGAIRTKHGRRNLYAEAITKRCDAMRASIAMANEALEVHEAALALLDGYESDEASAPTLRSPFAAFTGWRAPA